MSVLVGFWGEAGGGEFVRRIDEGCDGSVIL